MMFCGSFAGNRLQIDDLLWKLCWKNVNGNRLQIDDVLWKLCWENRFRLHHADLVLFQSWQKKEEKTQVVKLKEPRVSIVAPKPAFYSGLPLSLSSRDHPLDVSYVGPLCESSSLRAMFVVVRFHALLMFLLLPTGFQPSVATTCVDVAATAGILPTEPSATDLLLLRSVSFLRSPPMYKTETINGRLSKGVRATLSVDGGGGHGLGYSYVDFDISCFELKVVNFDDAIYVDMLMSKFSRGIVHVPADVAPILLSVRKVTHPRQMVAEIL
ncbi:hypothetical protein M8C21_022599 [Ambrosia artemisiifolia]|uniref:Uncharacterized protein n=1 Tax=Ambrosia artemisiifolia TaxID=4212 RepID=A0AAD5GIH8_AMBAR|nr:hypothetical protein M8C21_022599 [Ambrosia artemisiifolia]